MKKIKRVFSLVLALILFGSISINIIPTHKVLAKSPDLVLDKSADVQPKVEDGFNQIEDPASINGYQNLGANKPANAYKMSTIVNGVEVEVEPGIWGGGDQNHSVDRAFDGRCSSFAQAKENTLWDLSIDLGTDTVINQSFLGYNTDGKNYAEEYEILVSLDGESWNTAVLVSDNTNNPNGYICEFDPVTARYVKLHIISVGNRNYSPAVSEFGIYDTTQVLPVQASPEAGVVFADTQVELTTGTEFAEIYYTLNGEDPKISGEQYTSPITITAESIIKAYGKHNSKADSEVSTFNYSISTVNVDPMPGNVDKGISVTLYSINEDDEIYYTVDGSDPKTSDSTQQYNAPIVINNDTIIKAYTKNENNEYSKVVSLVYKVASQLNNIALGKEASTDSFKTGYEASMAIDNDMQTSWIANDRNAKHWLVIDLGGNYDITGTNITWEQPGKCYKYKIEVSSDGRHWYESVDRTGNSSTKQTITDSFEACCERYVRITVTGLEYKVSAGISNLEIYGYPSSPMKEVPTVPTTNGWPRPVIVPLPETTTGVSNPIISLGGTWKFTKTPPQGFWSNIVNPSSWSDAIVPGDLDIQGFEMMGKSGKETQPKENIEYPYKKKISIPADFEGKRIMLRFEGAVNYVRVWIDGKLVRTHRGGFTTWDCDITDYVIPGKDSMLTVGLTNENDSINYRHIRGLAGDVKLIALPQNYLTRIQYDTDLDDEYKDATLKLSLGMAFNTETEGNINLKLFDPNGNEVAISHSSIKLSSNEKEISVSIPVENPLKWDAEHPNLYTLKAKVKSADNTTVQTIIKKVGFREIEIDGNVMYVNGKEIKLRGINYHQSDALLGSASIPEIDREDLIKIKNANINFIRTAHMPQYEHVYDLCDELGIYVESETSVFFIDCLGVSPGSHNSPEFTKTYMDEFAEMVEKERNHACVLYWSLGNESSWGDNMNKMYDYIKKEDPTRPTKFSFPYTREDAKYEIHSKHYPNVNSNLGTDSKPEIYDEYAHIPAYIKNAPQLYDDPGIRNMYGETIKAFWEKIHATKGALGGAIWSGIDDAFEGGNIYSGIGEWGILDTWHREKPEYWNVKKGYSPIRIDMNSVSCPERENPLNIPVENWFDTTNLNEIKIKWTVGTENGEFFGPDIAASEEGNIIIPSRDWKVGDVLELEFYNAYDRHIDSFRINIGKRIISSVEEQGSAPVISDNDNEIIVTGDTFKIIFDKTTGMIKTGEYKEKQVITGGPFLNMGIEKLDSWSLDTITSNIQEDKAVITINGAYGSLGCKFILSIDGAGLLNTTYTVNNPLETYYNEMGIAYNLVSSIDRISWERNGIWSAYPEGHSGRNIGTAYKDGKIRSFGVKPEWNWEEDAQNFYLFGKNDSGERGSNDFRGSKTEIYYASMLLKDSNIRLTAESDGTNSVRASINDDGTIRFNVNNFINYNFGWGDKNRRTLIHDGYTNDVDIRLTDLDCKIENIDNLAVKASTKYEQVNDGIDNGADSNTFICNEKLPKTITLSWDKGQSLNSVVLKSWYCQGQAPIEWDIEVTYDGITWNKVASSGEVDWKYINNKIESKEVVFDRQIDVKGLRVIVLKANKKWGNFVINEIEVYDKDQEE